MRDATTSPALDPGALVPLTTSPAGQSTEPWFEATVSLPRDHPAWQRDVLSISTRVRAIVAQLRPIVVRVLTFWDHAVHGVAIGSRRLEIDPSGCYRVR